MGNDAATIGAKSPLVFDADVVVVEMAVFVHSCVLRAVVELGSGSQRFLRGVRYWEVKERTLAVMLLIVLVGQVTRFSRSTTHAVATLARGASMR